MNKYTQAKWREFPREFLIEMMNLDGIPKERAEEIYDNKPLLLEYNYGAGFTTAGAKDASGRTWWLNIEIVQRT